MESQPPGERRKREGKEREREREREREGFRITWSMFTLEWLTLCIACTMELNFFNFFSTNGTKISYLVMENNFLSVLFLDLLVCITRFLKAVSSHIIMSIDGRSG